ncbi:MAG TPA: hypothetical protein VF666_14345 [Pyrinomonadaceae bacterium]
MKQAFRLSSAAIIAFIFLVGALSSVQAQLSSSTPDSFVFQITSTAPTPTPAASPTPTPSPSPTPTGTPLPNNSYAWDMSNNGRFVVIESSGDIATTRSNARNNADGNREIFLFDYAQRRIFQITDTKSALVNTSLPANLSTNIEVEVSNNRPALSRDGKWIVFQSNAYSTDTVSDTTSPYRFDGNNFKTQLKADGNQEIFLYRIPDYADVPDLSSGSEVATVELTSETGFFRITRTAASRPPSPGAGGIAPDMVDDNRFPSISDNGSVVAFVSSRNLTTENGGESSNTDLNPEIFAFTRIAGDTVSGKLYRITNSTNPNVAINRVFNANPSLSSNGQTIAFISTADYTGNGITAEAEANRGNAEIYTIGFNGSAIVADSLRRVTSTPPDTVGRNVNVLSPGRRLSPDGKFLLFETTAEISATGTASATLQNFLGTYLYNVDANSYTLVGPRTTSGGDVLRFPTFTGNGQEIVFASSLNFRADGSAPPTAAEGLNPESRIQIFSSPIPASPTATQSFRRLTTVPSSSLPSETRPLPSETTQRVAFSYANSEFGFGNADGSFEAYYLLVPLAESVTPAPSPSPAASPGPLEFLTGASLRPVVSASPAPTPPSVAVTGLAPGMVGIGRSATVALAPSVREVDKANGTTDRRPQLPIELNGVSVSFNNAAAGLYFVSPTQINFVIPPALAASTTPARVVVYNRNSNTLIRSSLVLNAAQPDIWTTTNGAGGRAAAFNATDKCATPTMTEPFNVQTTRRKVLADGTCSLTETETVDTEVLFLVTGMRGVTLGATGASVSVQIKGAKDVTLTGDRIVAVRPSNTAGFDELIVRLSPDLAASGDSTVVISVTIGGVTFTSRPIDSAPRITIN